MGEPAPVLPVLMHFYNNVAELRLIRGSQSVR
jgi:hypothetical protein